MPSLPLVAWPPASNTTVDALDVICAWPLSGQYGPGSRLLYVEFISLSVQLMHGLQVRVRVSKADVRFRLGRVESVSDWPFTYFLIGAMYFLATSIFARRSEWLKASCFAATMLFPAVAALHGIVLAAVHVKGAVDMNIYGAFQICSVGTVAAPIIIELYPTYLHKLGRKLFLLWSGLVFAGLLGLTVEFYRMTKSKCLFDDAGNSISLNTRHFPYGNITCGLPCSFDLGPYSPIRNGSTSNIYVIPASNAVDTAVAVNYSTAAFQSFIFTWRLPHKLDGKTDFHSGIRRDSTAQPTEGTNSSALKKISLIDKLLNAAEYLPAFALILWLLVFGEMNLFSAPVRYQNEPMSSVGEWAPIVGTGFALLVGFVQGQEASSQTSTSDTEQGFEISNEEHRESILPQTSEQTNRRGDAVGRISPTLQQTPSSTTSLTGAEPQSPPPPPPPPSPTTPKRPHFSTLPFERASIELQHLPSSSSYVYVSREERLRRHHSFQALPTSRHSEGQNL